jgi:hypothetical protein
MRKYLGHWWTPSFPNERVTGTLTLRTREGPTLDLITDIAKKPDGSLPGMLQRDALSAQAVRAPIIHGQAYSMECFTLYDGFIRYSNRGMGAASTASLHFNHGFQGACIEDPASLPVTHIRMRYPGVTAWLDVRQFVVNYGNGQKQVCVSHEMREPLVFRIDDRRQLILGWGRSGPGWSRVETRISMRVLPWLEIDYDVPVTPEEACDDASVVAELLSMFLGVSTVARQIRMLSDQCTFQLKDETYRTELRALGAQFSLPQSFRDWTPDDVLIPWNMVCEDFESFLQRWFGLRQRCWDAIVPYLSRQRSPAPFAGGRFFDLAAIAESLHVHLCPGDISFPDDEARALCEKVLSFIPKDRRRNFWNALRWVNALTYKERLERLLQRFPTLTKDVIGDAKEQAAFCKLVKDLRHTEAHRLKTRNQRDVSGRTHIRIAAKLKVILDAWILAEIGLPTSAIEDAMRNTRRYWYYASRESWPWKIGGPH